MINTVLIPKAYSEVYNFINALGIEYKNKIPINIYKTIEENRDKNYNPIFEKNQKIQKEMISKEGLALISALNLEYWCDDKEKTELKEIYVKNTELENEKYSSKNLFNKNIKEKETTELITIDKKESFFEKILNKIKSFFHI